VDQRVLLALAVPLLPLAAFALPLLFARRSPSTASRGAVRAGVSIGAIALAFLAAAWLLYGQAVTSASINADILWLQAGRIFISMGILLNPLSALMLVIVTGVSLLVQIYSLGYMKGDPAFGRFFSYLSLFSFSMLTLVLADNFILLYMAWELVGLCSYLLIGFWYQKPAAARAAKKAFVVTRVGDLGFLIGILVLSIMAGTFNFADVARYIGGGSVPQGQITLVVLLLFCGAIGKSGQFPLHVWLPDAMEGPTPVSALIHSATMVAAGVFMVARLYDIFQASPDALRVVASLGAFTAVFAAAIALAQNDIKRVLAYSTISQLGYMMLALGVGGYGAGVFHLTTHAAFKTLLFLCAGSVIHAMGTNDIWHMGGLRKPMPVTTGAFLVAVLAIAGIFPLSGFWSKDEILQAALASGQTWLYTVAMITVFLTAFYMSRVFFVVFTGKARGEAGAHGTADGTAAHGASSDAHGTVHAHESPRVMTVPLIILAVLAAGLGLVGSPLLAHDIHSFLVPALGGPAAIDLPLLLQSNALALAGILVAFLVYGRKPAADPLRRALGPVYTALSRKLWVDELYMLAIRGLFFTTTKAIAWFDRHVVDGVVNLVGAASQAGGALLRRTVTGKVQGYALIILCGLLVTLALLLAFGGFSLGGLSFGGIALGGPR
jgi:NADH-quinone oxidoreductase subunit L